MSVTETETKAAKNSLISILELKQTKYTEASN